MDDWIQITQHAKRDLSAMDQSRMSEIAAWLWERNPIANRMIEIPVSYLSADGCTLVSDDPDLKEALDAMWHSAINRMDEFLEQIVREMSMYGEQCWPVFSNESTGAVQVAYLDPLMIETVYHDPNNIRQPIGIVTKADPITQNKKSYKIFVGDDESVFSNATKMLRKTFNDGDCLYGAVNKLVGGTRGRSDLLPVMDWLDSLDLLMFGELDRSKFLRAFVWHLQMEGADDQAVKDKSFSPPSSGGTYVSNDKESLSAVTPNFNASDGETTINLFRNHCLAGMSIPQHWYADAGDVNRATAESMAEPAFRSLERRQRQLGFMFVQLGQYTALKWAKANNRAIDLSTPEFRIKCQWPELVSKDATKYTQAMMQIITAVNSAIASNMMAKKDGIALINAIAESLGVTIDEDGELGDKDPDKKDEDPKPEKIDEDKPEVEKNEP